MLFLHAMESCYGNIFMIGGVIKILRIKYTKVPYVKYYCIAKVTCDHFPTGNNSHKGSPLV